MLFFAKFLNHKGTPIW